MNIPFHKPYMTEDEVSAAVEVIRNGWTTMGPVSLEFEKQFSSYMGGGIASALSSCTAALHLALIVNGVGPGDEVVLPAVTFASTAAAVIYCGGRPVFADIDPETHCISPESAAEKITSRTRVLIPVHYAGTPCDMEALEEIVQNRNISLVHDCAHALPSRYRGALIGSGPGEYCYSFYATKTLSSGEGGMLLTDNPDYADRARRLRLHGITKDAWKRYTAEGSWQYDLEEPGYKYNPNDIASAVAIKQLEKLDLMNEARGRISEGYNAAFSNTDGLIPYRIKPDSLSSWHLYPLKLDTEALTISRDMFIEELKNLGVGTSVHFIPLYRFTYYKNAGYRAEDFPCSERVFSSVISLPIYPSMTDEETAYVIEAVRSLAEKFKR